MSRKFIFFFLLHEICVLFEKEKKFLSTVILNSGKYYIYQIESIMGNIVHVF